MATYEGALPRAVTARRAVARQVRAHRRLALALVLGPPLIWMAGFYLGPLVYLLLESLWQIQNYNVVQVWTLANYTQIFSEPVWLDVLRRTVVMASLVTLSAIVLALPLAYFLVRYTRRWRHLLYLAVLIPLWSSYLVRVFAWKTILGRDGLLNTFLIGIHVVHQPISALLYSNTAVYITLLQIWLPYMVIPVYAAIERIPPSLYEASSDLGARGWRTILHVVWPLAFPGILAGSIFVFSLSMGDFITPLLMGNGTQFIGNVIADQFGIAYNYPFGAALAILPLIVLTVFLAIARRFGVLEAL
ncbi:MAG TPA: ABC transporter permease [Chloroflexota bacterium]|nr:ABC transporter permease [Chloroflexota bacterium]